MTATNEVDLWISFFLNSSAMDNVDAYLAAGRCQEHAPADELRLAWVMAMNLIGEGRKSFLDLALSAASELLIRALDLPLDMLNDKRFLLKRVHDLGLAERLKTLKPEIDEFMRRSRTVGAKH